MNPKLRINLDRNAPDHLISGSPHHFSNYDRLRGFWESLRAEEEEKEEEEKGEKVETVESEVASIRIAF